MSDDLVKRARGYGDDPQDVSLGEWAEWSHKWADRIEELEAKLAKATELANSAVNALDEIQNYEQPDDPWAENALTMGELDAFDFNVLDARTTLAEMKGDENG